MIITMRNRFSIFRYFSTYASSLMQLSADIDLVYGDLNENFKLDVSRYRLALIQQKIFNGYYVLNPLRIKYIHKLDMLSFLSDTLPFYPDIMIGDDPKDLDFIRVVMPSDQEDLLILMALSIMLLRLSYGSLPEGGYRLEDRIDSFYNQLKQMRKVDRLYRLDLRTSLTKIPISLVLNKVSSLVGEGAIYKLIESFLNLPIIDDSGANYRDDIAKGGVPPVGEISKVLFNIVLMHTFDREFEKRYPGISFSRFSNEVFISETRLLSSHFNEKELYDLLKQLNLKAEIHSIEPGDEPLKCYNKIAILNTMGRINICDPLDFY